MSQLNQRTTNLLIPKKYKQIDMLINKIIVFESRKTHENIYKELQFCVHYNQEVSLIRISFKMLFVQLLAEIKPMFYSLNTRPLFVALKVCFDNKVYLGYIHNQCFGHTPDDNFVVKTYIKCNKERFCIQEINNLFFTKKFQALFKSYLCKWFSFSSDEN